MRRTIEFVVAGALLCACQVDGESADTGPVFDGPWIEEAELTIQLPQLYVPPPESTNDGRPRQHPLGDSVGWAQWQTRESAFQLNAITLYPLRRLTPLIEQAREEAGVDRGTRLEWGPYPDPRGQPLEWLVTHEAARVELRVRAEDSDGSFTAFYSLERPGSSGELTINTSLITELPALGSHIHDEVRDYTGSVLVAFDYGDEQRIDVDWVDFAATADALVDIDFRPSGRLSYERRGLGSGHFSMQLTEAWDDDIGFTGPDDDLATLELSWNDDQSGFARLIIPETGSENPTGDPVYGALEIHECHDRDGDLMWRDITDAYLEAQPEYEKGEPTDCSGDSPWPAVD